MENKSLLDLIKSKYVFELIFSYIKDKVFICKLYKYTKYFQKKLGFNVIEYYLNKKEFWYKYLYQNFYIKVEPYLTFLERFKLDKNKAKELAIKYFKNLIEENKKNNININYSVSFECPFFDEIVKEGFLENFFHIEISEEYIKKSDNLKNIVCSKFDELNKSNTNYPSLQISNSYIFDIDYFKDLNINFKQIKKLSIFAEYIDIKKSFLDIMENNLIYLDLYLTRKNEINSDILEKINNLKFLKYL